MRIQTLSILAGTAACNARCPFCVSKMTVAHGVGLKPQEVNWPRFEKAVKLAEMSGCTTAMITGKGEPTLFPDQITEYLRIINERIPILELQTNAITLYENPVSTTHLANWLNMGLNTIAISVVHYDPEKNRQIYTPYRSSYINLTHCIKQLRSIGYTVRLAVVCLRGYLDNPEAVDDMIEYAQANNVEQLSFRPVTSPSAFDSNDNNVYQYIQENHLTTKQIQDLDSHFEHHGSLLLNLPYGAKIFDIRGQNVAWTNCLTESNDPDDIRQLIFYPDGHLRYSWTKPGAIIL